MEARPSTTGSPQPTTPSSVSTRHSSQRGGTVLPVGRVQGGAGKAAEVGVGGGEEGAHRLLGGVRVAGAHGVDDGAVRRHRVGFRVGGVHEDVAFHEAGGDEQVHAG